MCLESVFSVIAGFLLLNQRMTPREILGCGIMFAARSPHSRFLQHKRKTAAINLRLHISTAEHFGINPCESIDPQGV